jgi:hypothetical protein
MSQVLYSCSVIPNEMVVISLFSNCCNLTNIEVYNSLNNLLCYLGYIIIVNNGQNFVS